MVRLHFFLIAHPDHLCFDKKTELNIERVLNNFSFYPKLFFNIAVSFPFLRKKVKVLLLRNLSPHFFVETFVKRVLHLSFLTKLIMRL